MHTWPWPQGVPSAPQAPAVPPELLPEAVPVELPLPVGVPVLEPPVEALPAEEPLPDEPLPAALPVAGPPVEPLPLELLDAPAPVPPLVVPAVELPALDELWLEPPPVLELPGELPPHAPNAAARASRPIVLITVEPPGLGRQSLGTTKIRASPGFAYRGVSAYTSPVPLSVQ